MSVTAAYNQLTSATANWIGTFKMGGVLYGIQDPNKLYSISGGTATYLRNVSGDAWGVVRCDGTYIYRASSTNVLKIDPLTGNVPDSSALSGVRSIALDAAGARIFALLNSGALYVFTTNNLTQYYVTNVGAATYGPGLCYLNGALYIPVYGGKIKKYVVDTGVLTTLNNSLSASWLCMDTDGTYLYATVDGGRIYKIDPTDATTYEEVTGDSAGRFWYSCYFDSSAPASIKANVYGGYYYNIQLGPAVPTASVPSSTIYNDTSVTLSCSTSGAVIKYTTDGSTPGLSNGTTYSGAITINKTTTIKFCAIYNGYVTAGVDLQYIIYKGILGTYTKKLVIGANTNYKMTICHAGSTMYLLYNQYVYRYNGSTFDFVFAPSISACSGIATDGTYIWVSGLGVVRYKISDGTTTTYSPPTPTTEISCLTYGSSIFGVGYGPNDSNGTYKFSGTSYSYLTGTIYSYNVCKVGSNYYASRKLGNDGLAIISNGVAVSTISGTPLTKALCTDGTDIYFACELGYVYKYIVATGAIIRVFGEESAREWVSLSYDTTTNILYGLYTDTNGDNCLASIGISNFEDGTVYVYKDGTWKLVNSIYAYKDGVWKLSNQINERDGTNLWSKIYQSDW